MSEQNVSLKVVLDTSKIGKADIAKVQKILDKYPVQIRTDLNRTQLMAEAKKIRIALEAELQKATGTKIKLNDSMILDSLQKIQKETTKTAKEQEKLTEALERVHSKAVAGREAIAKEQEKIFHDPAKTTYNEKQYSSSTSSSSNEGGFLNTIKDFSDKVEAVSNLASKTKEIFGTENLGKCM